MNKKYKLGLHLLASKVLSVIAASVGSIAPAEAKESNALTPFLSNDEENIINKSTAKPKLVLRLATDGRFHLVAQHTSHSSHRSHSSHSSHSSHYSSSPSYPRSSTPAVPYTPPRTTSPVTPSTITPRIYTSPKISTTPSTSLDKEHMGLFERVLYKTCKGDDVKRLQRKLLALGYSMIVTGYFGDKTEDAVKKFQTNNELEPNGRVDRLCWSMIANN